MGGEWPGCGETGEGEGREEREGGQEEEEERVAIVRPLAFI